MKKLLSMVIISILLVLVFSSSVFAAEDVYSLVEETNERIERMIDRAVERADDLNPESPRYDQRLDRIINRLVDRTNALAARTIRKAKRKFGVTVICEYVEVQIGNRTVLIDPLRVVGW